VGAHSLGAAARRATAALRKAGRTLDRARSAQALEARVLELEARLDHERLYPTEWVNRRMRDQFGYTVRGGPFRGLVYPDWAMTHVDLFSPKLLGIYEQETHVALEALIAERPRRVVNIGAAEGYYAVGLALRLPDAEVYAFERQDALLAQLRAIAEHNGVADRVRLVGDCDATQLRALAQPGTLIVSDCEGCERELLDPAWSPELASCALLVETHDLLVPGVTDLLCARFAASHEVERLDSRPRYVDDVPELDFMPLVSRQLAISEFRHGPMSWLAMRPRNGG
jgi:predicted O-methyltransferase YrrM